MFLASEPTTFRPALLSSLDELNRDEDVSRSAEVGDARGARSCWTWLGSACSSCGRISDGTGDVVLLEADGGDCRLSGDGVGAAGGAAVEEAAGLAEPRNPIDSGDDGGGVSIRCGKDARLAALSSSGTERAAPGTSVVGGTATRDDLRLTAVSLLRFCSFLSPLGPVCAAPAEVAGGAACPAMAARDAELIPRSFGGMDERDLLLCIFGEAGVSRFAHPSSGLFFVDMEGDRLFASDTDAGKRAVCVVEAVLGAEAPLPVVVAAEATRESVRVLVPADENAPMRGVAIIGVGWSASVSFATSMSTLAKTSSMSAWSRVLFIRWQNLTSSPGPRTNSPPICIWSPGALSGSAIPLTKPCTMLPVMLCLMYAPLSAAGPGLKVRSVMPSAV